VIKLKNILNEALKISDVKYAMKMAFDNVPGNWSKALKSVTMYGKEIGLVMSSYMGPNKTLQAIVDEFNSIMKTKFKIDVNSFEKGHNTSIRLREGKLTENFKKGDRVKYTGKKTIFIKLDPNKVYNVQDVVKDGKGGWTIVVDQYPVKAKDLKKEGKLNEALKKDGHTYNVEEIGATTGTNRGGIPLDKAYAGKDGMLGNHGTYISWSDVKRLMRKYSR